MAAGGVRQSKAENRAKSQDAQRLLFLPYLQQRFHLPSLMLELPLYKPQFFAQRI